MTLVYLIVGAAAVFIMVPSVIRIFRGGGKAIDAAIILGALALLAWLLGFI